MVKKLYRSKDNKIFAGVIGGLAEYFEIDAAVLRVIWILILIMSGIVPAVIAYFLFLLVVPPPPEEKAK